MAHELAADTDSESKRVGGDDPPPVDEPEGRGFSLSRRSYIGRVAAVAAAFPAGVVGTTRSATVSRHGIEFERLVDAVDDLGVDPTGREPVDVPLADTDDGDLVQFPDGTYRFDGDSDSVPFADQRRGFEGIGEPTFVTSPDHQEFILGGEEMDAVYVRGIDLDHRNPDTHAALQFSGARVVIDDVAGPDGDSPVPTDGDKLTIRGQGTPTTYEVTTTGGIRPVGPQAAACGVSGMNAEGLVRSGTVSYDVDGEITDIRLEGPAEVYVNGDRADPDGFGTRANHLAFAADSGSTSYAFSVDRLSARAGTSNASGDLDRVRHTVTSGVETYRFDGQLASLRASGTVSLFVGGEGTDPAACGPRAREASGRR